MTTFTRRTALTGTLGALAVTAACSTTTAAPGAPAPSTPGRPSGSITVYNAQHESLTKEWIDGFSKATGVKVQYRQGSDTEMANQIATEGSASPADVFLTENSPV
jgi:iron(III) transport system substrate-binding protein